MQFRSSKLIFAVERLLKLGDLARKVPHVAIYNNICSNYSSIQRRKTIQVRKLFREGNYSREETINNKELLTAETIQRRKVFKGGNYLRKYGTYIAIAH